jgi:hypothetical protein
MIPDALEQAETLKQANKAIAPARGALQLVCIKCTRMGVFPSDTQTNARIDAGKAGWRRRLSDDATIYPDCAKQ